jgi:hypothetical protein
VTGLDAPGKPIKACLVGEVNNNWYDRCNHRYHANPKTTFTESAIFNDHFDLLPLLRRLVCQRKAA